MSDGTPVKFITPSTERRRRNARTNIVGTNNGQLNAQARGFQFADVPTPQLIDADVILTDLDGNLANGTLTVSGLLPETSSRSGTRVSAQGRSGSPPAS
jgi:hypothetical protein